jgi:hypothetical protein
MGDDVIGIHNGDNSRIKRNLFPFQPLWVAGAVPPFMVTQNRFGNMRKLS